MTIKIAHFVGWLALCVPVGLAAQPTTVEFIQYVNEAPLKMDIYAPQNTNDLPTGQSAYGPIVIFVFGGGFLAGSRNDAIYLPYYNFLTRQGYAVAAIDYRLGLKDSRKPPSLFNRKPLINAISFAVEDLYAATNYLLKHAKTLHIDTTRIMLSGSSAGAITALQADYEKRNNLNNAKVLPVAFQYAAIISFAGAIFSREGKPDYAVAADATVPWCQRQLGSL